MWPLYPVESPYTVRMQALKIPLSEMEGMVLRDQLTFICRRLSQRKREPAKTGQEATELIRRERKKERKAKKQRNAAAAAAAPPVATVTISGVASEPTHTKQAQAAEQRDPDACDVKGGVLRVRAVPKANKSAAVASWLDDSVAALVDEDNADGELQQPTHDHVGEMVPKLKCTVGVLIARDTFSPGGWEMQRCGSSKECSDRADWAATASVDCASR